MDIRIKPQMLSGGVTPPPSKSLAHRLLIAAALSDGISDIKNIMLSEDIKATLRCIETLGGKWEQHGNNIRIWGIDRNRNFSAKPLHFDCGESGSTLRFFIPIALSIAGGGIFTGRGRLMQRPQKPYFDIFDKKNISYELKDEILTISGKLTPGEYELPGNVSSQFFTGLMFALPLSEGNSVIKSTTVIESEDYTVMTAEVMRLAEIEVIKSADGRKFTLEKGEYKPFEQTVESDWSQAGFWYAANFLGANINLEGLNKNSSQGDRVISVFTEKLAKPGDTEIDISNCPDLLPPLAVMAAVREGKTDFTNAARLRIKESDRLHTVCELINSLGGEAKEGAEILSITGKPKLSGGTVKGENDHRIVMAAAVAACCCTSEVIISGAEAVNKSYPDFFGEYTRLGGKIDVI